MFFAQIDFPRSFKITEIEAAEHLGELAETIRNNYALYQDREIKPPIQ